MLGQLLACMLSCVHLYATPWTAASQGPVSIEFSRQEYWGGLPFPPPRDLPDGGIEPPSLAYALASGLLLLLLFYHWCHLEAFSSVQSLSHVQLFATPWTEARQASLSITNRKA